MPSLEFNIIQTNKEDSMVEIKSVEPFPEFLLVHFNTLLRDRAESKSGLSQLFDWVLFIVLADAEQKFLVVLVKVR